jgi:putative nucleotidyltransferase with HDIG domain
MMRVLFVDDEANLLQAMRRALHHMRNEWNMEFASSGAAALENLAKSPADVIVSDMRMPGMDGWQLLAEVKVRYPQTVRLILSGHADASSIMRAIGVAHQYLAKPCDSAVLKAAIAQTLSLRRLLSSDRLAPLAGDVDVLPSTPKTFQDMLTCLQQPGVQAVDVARIVARDVAMTANIMKLVNSAFFGVRQPITSVDGAVRYLGLDTVGALVLGDGIFHNQPVPDIPGFSLERLWEHSLRTASTARSIALHEKLPAPQVEMAYLAALLHDVGRIVFATKTADAGGLPMEDVWVQMQDHHAEVGAYLLGLWGFPTPIVQAVAFHHTPCRSADSHFGLEALIHVADRLTHGLAAKHADPTQLGIDVELVERLDLAERLRHWWGMLNVTNTAEAVQ